MKFNFKFSNLCGTVYRQGNVLFTPDGNTVLSPVGNRISTLDLVNHKSRTMAFENRHNIARLALSPCGSSLISVDEKGGALLVNFHKRVVLCQFKFKTEVKDLQFSPDSRLIAVSAGQHLQIWKAPPLITQFRPFHLVRTMTGHYDDITCIAWSPDSKFVLTGSRDMTCRLYAVDRIKGFIPITITAHKNHIVGVFFRSNLEPDMECAMYSVSKDGTLCTWKFEFHTTAEIEEKRYGIERSRKRRRDMDPVDVKAHWMARSNIVLVKKHFFLADHHAEVTSVKLHSTKESELLVVGFETGVFSLYEMPDFNLVHTLTISQKRINTIAINPSGEWLAFGAAKLGQLLVWEWQSETYILKQQGHFFDMNTIAYSPDGQLIATGGDDGKVKLWNAETGFCFVTFKDHTGPVNQVVFSPKGNVVVSSSLDGTVRAFDLVRYRNFRTFTSPTPLQFTCLAIDNSGEMVVAGSLDPFEIYLWSLRTARILDVLSGHTGPVSSVCFNPAHPFLVSSSWDATVRIWDVYSRKAAVETLKHSADVLALAVRPDGDQVCSSDLTGQLYFWDPQDGTLQGTIEGRKDIMGGRRRDDARAAKNATHSLAFTSLCYSSDGKCILAGGNSKYVCIYQVQQRVLLKRFEITNNLSLDGILTYLNSRNMTEAGPLALIDDVDSSSDKEDRKDNSLPGAKRSDFSDRKTPLVARTKCVKFSPDGRQWAAASTEGLLIYSVDETLFFDPNDLDMEVTPSNCQVLMEGKEFAKALVMALRLNEKKVLEKVCGEIPVNQIPIVVASLPMQYMERILTLLAEALRESPHLQFYLTWIQCIMTQHGSALRKHSMRMLSTLRAVQKSLREHYERIAAVCHDNYFTLGFLTKRIKMVKDSKLKES
ncbi:hypothetical protein AAMO2058_000381600 [Amorphochlora amoebiformis]|mmetsp:Transcript_22682/g.35625  ORF Transcript_22682/g.35625 Transcript_22682/m.35625 type:complete len:881 (-) Transcript_22682:92-2734(-)